MSSLSSIDDTTNTVEDTWESGESGTKEGSEEHVLFFSSSGSTDNTADTLEDTWESGETGTKEGTKE